METHALSKPVNRSPLRLLAGKEFFILKRQVSWFFAGKKFASPDCTISVPFPIIEHKSLLLRPLKNVDMCLQHNKVRNLQLATSKIHGVVLKPGQTFSLWQRVGRPTTGKGYLDGLTLKNGTISKGTGGGLCQLGNLIYWMVLHTPLTVTERWRHGYDVFPDMNRTIPFACGATLSYNYVDLQVKNETEMAFRIDVWLDETYLNGAIRSEQESEKTYSVFETDHSIRHQWWGGYTRHNKIWKRCEDMNGEFISEELVAENHAIMMYNPLLE